MRVRLSCMLMVAVVAIAWHGLPVSPLAAQTCQISVTTILAGRDDTTIDPKLKPNITELQSTFNYTSYRELGSERLSLEVDQSGTVSLPAGHRLKITLQKIRGSRADIALQMTKQDQAVFQTQIQLLNGGSLFVGGPKYLNGNLIFKISSTY